MRYFELEELRIKAKREYDRKIEVANREYAIANQKYKIGDIIEDHYHIIKIEKTNGMHFKNNRPQFIYKGVELTKKLEPKKNQQNQNMYEYNVERKLN